MRILITGASSGIGFEAARSLARDGHTVFAGARRVSLMEPLKEFGVVPVELDVCSEESMLSCLSVCGDIDILVNCAGYGSFGAIENVPLEEARRQMEVNLFGLARLCQLVLPGMRERGTGKIINISSIAGKVVLYFGGWYHVSKFAVEAFSDALRMEMKPFGISVSLVEPGGIRTPWGSIAAEHLRESSRGTAYEAQGQREADTLEWAYSRKLLSSPAVVTRAVRRAVRARHPRARYVVGFGARTLLFWHSVLPARWWDALMRIGGRLKVS